MEDRLCSGGQDRGPRDRCVRLTSSFSRAAGPYLVLLRRYRSLYGLPYWFRPSSTRSSARAPARWISVAPEHAAPDRPAIFTSSGRTATLHWSTVLGPKRNRLTLPRTRSVQWPWWGRVREFGEGGSDPAPHGRSVVVAGSHELVGSGAPFRLVAIALEHQLRRSPNVDLRDHALKLHIYGQ
jgi:hypothetical protein